MVSACWQLPSNTSLPFQIIFDLYHAHAVCDKHQIPGADPFFLLQHSISFVIHCPVRFSSCSQAKVSVSPSNWRRRRNLGVSRPRARINPGSFGCRTNFRTRSQELKHSLVSFGSPAFQICSIWGSFSHTAKYFSGSVMGWLRTHSTKPVWRSSFSPGWAKSFHTPGQTDSSYSCNSRGFP